MTREEKIEACKKFYEELCEALSATHENVASCNADMSAYLIPKGSMPQLSYYGKPEKSFRVSDHWSWFSSTKKCKLPNYVQCLSVDAPYRRNRPAADKASKPVYAIQVCFFGADNKYHCVFGEVFDPKTKKWSWKNASIASAAALVM